MSNLYPDPSAPWPEYVRQVNEALQRWLALARQGAFDQIEAERKPVIQTLMKAVYIASVRAQAFELGLAVDPTMRWRGHGQAWFPVLLNMLLAAQISSDRAMQAQVWDRLGTLSHVQDDQTRAFAAYRTALGIAEELGEDSELAAARGLAGLTDVARKQGARDEAIRYAGEALFWARRSGDPAMLARVYLVNASAHGDASAWHQSFQYAQMSYIYSNHVNSALDQAKALHAMGHIYIQAIHRPAQAMFLIRRAAEIYRAAGADYLLALLDVLRGNLCVQLQEWPEAEAHFRRAIGYFEAHKMAHDLAMAREYLGRGLTAHGQWEEARHCLQAALEGWQRLGNAGGRLSALSALGDLYARRGLREEAAAHLEAALKLAETLPTSVAPADVVALARRRLRDLTADQPPGGHGPGV